MKKYISVKLIKAKEMTRQEYNDYRGWKMPSGESQEDKGFLVEYLDGGKSNHPDHDGYISWSPDETFKNAYKETDGLSFGLAIEAIKKGYRVARQGWNGKGMWLGYVADTWGINFEIEDGIQSFENLPYIIMKTVDNKIIPWLASQTDLLAEDWGILG